MLFVLIWAATPAFAVAFEATAGLPKGLVTIVYPQSSTLFPPEIVPPKVRWTDSSEANAWTIAVRVGKEALDDEVTVSGKHWTPAPPQWREIQRRSRSAEAVLTVKGFRAGKPDEVLSEGEVRFRTSVDEVGASIFYREVILPFIEAVKDPARIRWRLGSVSRAEAPVVLAGVPVCGNCHSFPKDAGTLAMDVDYANSKASYVLAPIQRITALRPQDVISWDEYRREDGQQTFGLLSQISPDGQVVVSTVKDRSVFVPTPNLEYSQLFFPIKGILTIYHRRTHTFQSLPGADDPKYVQSNPNWSPDGKQIVFARAPAYELKVSPAKGRVLLTPEECDEFLKDGKPFRFDLYRIPYNDGQGGTAEPLAGASGDGLSHYFGRYSPDGRWIVFCTAKNYMLLQPDSELWIIPAAGGEARRLRGNTPRMNSWHSWSPNSRWLVFSSKANGPYTQLFLTHIDEAGESSPPVELPHLTEPDRAANIPEFVQLGPETLERIDPQFLNDYSYARAGFVCEQTGEFDRAVNQYKQALQLNSDNAHAHERLGHILCNLRGDFLKGLPHCREAVRLNPNAGQARFVMGMALFNRGDHAGAVQHLSAALQGFADGTDPNYNPLAVHSLLGSALLLCNNVAGSAEHFREALRLDPQVPELHYYLAIALARQGVIEESIQEQRAACRLKADFELFPDFYELMSDNLAKANQKTEAADFARRGLAAANKQGDRRLAGELARRLESLGAKP